MSARSWLFAPGDSERKMEKATAGSADIVIFDLEDAVADGEKPKARSMVRAFLTAHADHRARLWVRINPIQGPYALADLAAVMPAAPAGIMLPKPRGRADAELLDHYLTAFEACHTAMLTLGGMGYAQEYHVERYLRESLIPRTAPVSPHMILNFLAEKVLDLPKSY